MRSSVSRDYIQAEYYDIIQTEQWFHPNAYPTSDLELQAMDASDFTTLWDRLFIPTNSSNSQDLSMINDITFSIDWLIRLYDDEYPDDVKTPLRYLENFLAIPLQFMVTTLEFLNQTSSVEGLFPLPNDMKTTAVGGETMERLQGEPWVVWLFVSTSAITMVAVGLFLIWMMMQKEPLLLLTGIQEMDFLDRIAGASGNHQESRPFLETFRLNEKPDNSSRPKISWKAKGFTVLLRPGDASSSEGGVLLVRSVKADDHE